MVNFSFYVIHVIFGFSSNSTLILPVSISIGRLRRDEYSTDKNPDRKFFKSSFGKCVMKQHPFHIQSTLYFTLETHFYLFWSKIAQHVDSEDFGPPFYKFEKVQ